jgi:hypothetical protein
VVQRRSLYLEWGGDFVLTPNGGLQEAVGWDLVRQNLERLILTNFGTVQPDGEQTIGDDIFHPEYGIGTRATIGQVRVPNTVAEVKRKVKSAIAQYNEIAQNPPPIVSVTPIPQGFEIYIDVFMSDMQPGTIALIVTP